MKSVFLSASVPVKGRGDFYLDSEPYLIQLAVREFVLSVLGKRKIIFGGHPSITPMIWAICEDLSISFADNVEIYQSRYFDGMYPDENLNVENIKYVDAVPNSRENSLIKLWETMLSTNGLEAALFIGGMDGVLKEYDIFIKLNPEATVLALSSPGGASKQLARQLGMDNSEEDRTLNYRKLFQSFFGV